MIQPAQSHYRAVVISPHLDDAVFSCGGAIAQMVREGPVLVLNINTRYLANMKNRGIVMTDARYREEADAAAFLGYETHRLDELDALFRRPAYASIANIFRPPPDFGQCVRDIAVLQAEDVPALVVELVAGARLDHGKLRPPTERRGVDVVEDLCLPLVRHALEEDRVVLDRDPAPVVRRHGAGPDRSGDETEHRAPVQPELPGPE